MKLLNRDMIFIMLMKRYNKKLDLYSLEKKEKLELSMKKVIIKLVNDLYDLSKIQIDLLTEEETFAFRKNLGILDDGFTQSRKVIGKIMDKNATQVETMFKIIDEKIVKEILLSIEDVKNLSKEEILELDVECLGLSVNTYNLIKRAGIRKISELKNMTTGEIRRIKCFRLRDAEEVVMAIHSLGLCFVDEETAVEDIICSETNELILQGFDDDIASLNKQIKELLEERDLLMIRLNLLHLKN